MDRYKATYTKPRQKTLLDANLGIEKLRLLFRLAKNMGPTSSKSVCITTLGE